MVCARVWSWCCHSSLSLLPLLGALGLKQVLDRPKVSCQKAGEYRNRSSTAGWEWTGGSGSGMGITGVILRHREVREPMLQTHPHRQPSTPGICWLPHESGVWWEGQLWPFSSLARSGSGWARKGWRESGFLRGVVYAALITGPGTYQGWVRTPSLCLQPSFGPFQELAGLREFFVALGSVLVLFFPSNMRAMSEVPKYCFVLNHLQGWWPTTLDQMFIWLCLWAGISSIGMPACVISWTQELFLGPKGIKIVFFFFSMILHPSFGFFYLPEGEFRALQSGCFFGRGGCSSRGDGVWPVSLSFHCPRGSLVCGDELHWLVSFVPGRFAEPVESWA